jgi:hypothetical protein
LEGEGDGEGEGGFLNGIMERSMSERVLVRVACLCAVLLPSLCAAQGIGVPPLFDTSSRGVQNTLQIEGAALSRDAASYGGSAALRIRRDYAKAAVTGGLGILSDGDFGFALGVSGQLKPGRWVAIDGDEKALTISGGPLVDLNMRAVDAIGHAYTASAALALVVIPTLPGFTAELSVAPRYELRRLQKGDSENTSAFGVQLGAAVGVARFVQVLFMADWVNEALRAPNVPPGDGGWTLGLGLRHRLPTN